MTSIGKENRSSQCLSYKEQRERERETDRQTDRQTDRFRLCIADVTPRKLFVPDLREYVSIFITADEIQ